MDKLDKQIMIQGLDGAIINIQQTSDVITALIGNEKTPEEVKCILSKMNFRKNTYIEALNHTKELIKNS